MVGPRVNASQFQEKHNRRTKAALQDMRDGIGRVTEAPGVKAAAKVEKMKAKINEALDSGKWERRVAAVSTEEWKRSMLEKGVGRVSAGLDSASGKVHQFAEQLLSHQAPLMEKIDAMPDVTLEDGIGRATAWIRGMAGFEFKR